MKASAEDGPTETTPSIRRRSPLRVIAGALLGGLTVAALGRPLLETERLLLGWALVWLLGFALALLVRGRSARGSAPGARLPVLPPPAPRAIDPAGILIFLVGFSACALLSSRSLAPVPAMHDEWSYLFQAKTYLAGRFWLPSQDVVPGLFDQIHVLNEGRFASRYFPGTGLWLAPFVALGHPHLGQWLAAGLSAALVHDAGRTVGGPRAGVIAGLLVALAPGVADFCNLLVAHAPTLLGLSLFLCGWARARSEAAPGARRLGAGVVAGAGLAFAMLCRPLTAAAVGLPFGLVLLAETAGALRTGAAPLRALRPLVATGAPILVGLLFLGAHDASITGSPWKTPYGLYNDLYTPRHVYGFENGTRGEAARAPKRDLDYDRWARNLTPEAAVRNARARLGRSLQASIGVVPFGVGVLVLVAAGRQRDRFWGLCGAAAITLHAAYFPYWFVGINAYHYVFESIPLYALVFAGASARVGALAERAGRPFAAPAFAALALVPALGQWLPLDAPFQTRAGQALRRGTSFEPAREQADRFARRVDEVVAVRPALVLVEQPPANFHFDPVVNDPTLDGPVLFGRYAPHRMELDAIAAAFPDRTLYLYAERRGRFERIDAGSAPPARADANSSVTRPIGPR